MTYIEFADHKKDILTELRSLRKKYLDHLIKIFYWKDTQYYAHWCREVYSFYSKISKTKETKKYPRADEIYAAIFGGYEDVFDDHLYNTVDFLNYDHDGLPQIDLNDLHTDELHKFIRNYSIWLSDRLSKYGEVSHKDVRQEIDMLLNI